MSQFFFRIPREYAFLFFHNSRDTAEKRKREQEIKNSPGYTRVEVLDGGAWADAVKDTAPRDGISVPALPTLEELGGLVAGDVIVLAGSAGMGKTTHACRVLTDVCLRGKTPTIFFSTEMSRNDVARWVAAIIEGCSVQQVPRKIPESVLTQLRASPVKMIDTGSLRIDDIETIVRGALGTRLVIIDHLTRLVTPRRESRTLEVGETCRRLKSLAKDCGLTVLELCQLNREGNDNTRPNLKALRDSGEIEQEADAVLFLWTAEKTLKDRFLKMAFYLAKNRHGAVAEVVANWDRELKKIQVIQ
jgi:replicative DNA helicase